MAHLEKTITAPSRHWFEPVANASLGVQAATIRRDISVSTNTPEMVMEATGLNTAQLQGKKVLDLASGLSTFVAYANENGSETVGVDAAYVSLEELVARGVAFDSRGYYEFVGDMSDLTIPLQEELRRRLDYLNSGGPRKDCLEDMDANPSRYIAGDVLDLPFANKAFDLVVCNSLLSSEPGLSSGFTEATILEALRVLRRQGELRIGPFYSDVKPEASKVKVSNIREAFEKAKQEKLAEKLSKISIGRDSWAYCITRSRKR